MEMSTLAERTYRGRARASLALFLATGWLAAASMALAVFAGDDFGRQVNMLTVGAYPILLLATLYFYGRSGGQPARPWLGYAIVFVLVWICLCVYGLVIDNSSRVIILDTLTFGTVLGSFWLGRRDEVWDDAKAPVMVLTALSILLAVWNTDSQVLTDRGILNEQAGSGFETGLILAPLFCLASVADRKVWRYYVLVLLSIGCLFTYLYFGRRGITTRCALEIFCATALLPAFLGMQRRTLTATAVLGVFAVGLWLYFPFDTLVRRFQGDYGIIDTLTIDNERLRESSLLIEEFSQWEVLVGRGVGGAFLVNAPRSFVLDKIDATRSGRVVLHAGAWLPFLKGGLLLQILYFLPLLALFFAAPRWRRLDPITKAALVGGLILFLFQFTEGSPTYSTPWVAFGIGLVMGRAQNAHQSLRLEPQPQRPTVKAVRTQARARTIAFTRVESR